MGINKRWRALAGLLLAAAAPAWGANLCSKAVQVATTDWEPYSYHDLQRVYRGLDAEMSQAILAEAGCTLVERESMPASRNLFLFGEGKVDMMTGASRTVERMQLAYFSVAYRQETVGIFTLAGSAPALRQVASFAELLRQGRAMLAPRAGWYGDELAAHQDSLLAARRLSQFTTFRQGISMLVAGRAPYLIGDTIAVAHAAASMGVKVEKLPFLLVNAPVHLMFSKHTMRPDDVRRIDAAIVRLRQRGTLERIRRAYPDS